MSKPKICLNMIVKNEAHIIHEFFNSIIKYINYWIISDTGSTDGTQKVIKDYFEKCKIPGELYEDEWKNFGYNRTLALSYCRNKCEYVFIMDADDLLIGDLPIKNIIHDGYLLKINKINVCHRILLVKESCSWYFRGVVHEIIMSSSLTNVQRLEGNYYIESRRLGDRNKDILKYQKDAELLLSSIENNIDIDLHDRYYYYLGQSYKDAEDYENALKYFKIRVTLQGNMEEKYVAYNDIGMCLSKLDKQEHEVFEAFMNAYKFRPSRGESLFFLGNYFISKEKYNEALKIFDKGIDIKLPVNDQMYVIEYIYSWGFKYKKALILLKLEKYEESFEILSNFLLEMDLSNEVRKSIGLAIDQILPFIEGKLTKYNQNLVNEIIHNKSKHKNKKKKNITLTIIYKNLNLFEKTMNSFLNQCKDIHLIDEWICINMNNNNTIKEKYPFFQFMNEKSMNIIRKKIQTKYWLNLEDNFLFFLPMNYISIGLEILERDNEISQILFNLNYADSAQEYDIYGYNKKHIKYEGKNLNY